MTLWLRWLWHELRRHHATSIELVPSDGTSPVADVPCSCGGVTRILLTDGSGQPTPEYVASTCAGWQMAAHQAAMALPRATAIRRRAPAEISAVRRDGRAALARGVITLGAGAVVLVMIGTGLGWWLAGALAVVATADSVWCWSQLPPRWRPW